MDCAPRFFTGYHALTSSLDRVGMFRTIKAIIDQGLDCNPPLTIDQLKLDCTSLLLMPARPVLIIVWN